VSLVFTCIAPHGDLEEIPELRTAMEELGRRFEAAEVETAIVVTPHNVHVERHFAALQEGSIARDLPAELDVGGCRRDEDHVEWAVADDLVGDAEIAASCVPRLGRHRDGG
jgi:aromatic ring-opening dioxygenase LigB subunit